MTFDPDDLLEDEFDEGIDPDDDNIDLDTLDVITRFQNKKTVAYKTVDTFAGITRKRLWLKNGDKPSTDGHEILVPFADEDFYRHVEEQLAHILFRTDPRAKSLFVKEYVGRVQQVAKKMNVEINEGYLQVALTHIVTLLERRRIGSLWGRLYEGSYEDMREIAHRKVENLLPAAHENILTYMTCLEVMPNEVDAGEFDKFRAYIEEAFQKVDKRGFAATLSVSKWLVMQMVNQLIRELKGLPVPLPPGSMPADAGPQQGGGGGDVSEDETDQTEPDEEDPSPPWNPEPPEATGEERAQALQNLVDKMGEPPEEVQDSVKESKFQKGRPSAKSQAQADQGLKSSVNDPDSFEKQLDETEEEMVKILDQARRAMRHQMNEDDWLQKDAMAKIKFIDVAPSIKTVYFDPEDRQIVQRLRAIFYRVMGRKHTQLEDYGIEVDVQAYIEHKTTGLPSPVFRNEGRGQGFKAFLLLDRSSSMIGLKTRQCERAARIIRRALKFPFVSTEIWGFTAHDPGEVVLSRFDPNNEVFLEHKGIGSGGLTPIHIAMRVAGRKLSEGTENKQCIVITDGFPTHQRRDGKWFNTQQLMGFVRDEGREMRRRGINLTGVMLGEHHRYKKDEIYYDLSEKQMQFMFGPRSNWRRMDPDRFDQDLVQLVARSFINYLRHR